MESSGDNFSSRRSVATTSVVTIDSNSKAKGSRSAERVIPESEPLGYQRNKLCKRGHRAAIVERECGVCFEGLPVWLWTIRLAEWSTIYITDTDEAKLRQYHVSTWDFVKAKLVIFKADNGQALPKVNLWLVSGPMSLILLWERRIETAIMACWVADCGRRKPIHSGSRCDWHIVSHAQVGGVTKATGMFGIMGLTELAVPDDPIRRSIGHIIKYSERPSPCTVPLEERH